MLRYPSTKQILTVAVLSALLAGCGKDSKRLPPTAMFWIQPLWLNDLQRAKDTSVELWQRVTADRIVGCCAPESGHNAGRYCAFHNFKHGQGQQCC